VILASSKLQGAELRERVLFIGVVSKKQCVVAYHGSAPGSRSDSGIHIFPMASDLIKGNRPLTAEEAVSWLRIFFFVALGPPLIRFLSRFGVAGETQRRTTSRAIPLLTRKRARWGNCSLHPLHSTLTQNNKNNQSACARALGPLLRHLQKLWNPWGLFRRSISAWASCDRYVLLRWMVCVCARQDKRFGGKFESRGWVAGSLNLRARSLKSAALELSEAGREQASFVRVVQRAVRVCEHGEG
jgi:hypothetical protein